MTAVDDFAQGKRVLLVEDDPAIRTLTSQFLAMAGYVVVEACDADEALAKAQVETPFDLLLTDIIMPGLDGRSLAHALAAEHPGLRTLYVTGYPEDALTPDSDDEVDVLIKPFQRQALIDKLHEILSR